MTLTFKRVTCNSLCVFQSCFSTKPNMNFLTIIRNTGVNINIFVANPSFVEKLCVYTSRIYEAVLVPNLCENFLFLSRSNEKLSRSNEKLSRSNEKLSRSNEKLSRSNEKVSRSNEKVSRSNEKLSRLNEKLSRSNEKLPRSNEKTISF